MRKPLVYKLLRERNWTEISALVRAGKLDPNWSGSGPFGKFTLLFEVICHEAEDLAVQLINAGARADCLQSGQSPLMLACGLKLHKVIGALVDAGADVNLKSPARDEDYGGGRTALMAAAEMADLTLRWFHIARWL